MNMMLKENSCLLVIDVQNAIVNDPNYTLYNRDKVTENVSKLVASARSNGLPIVFIQHTEPEGDFERNTDSWQIMSSILPKSDEVVFEKTTCDSFLRTPLQNYLDNQGIKHLYIIGMQTDYCIDTSVRSAFGKEYECTVISDAHSTFDNELLTAQQIITNLHKMWKGRFADLIDTAELLEMLGK